VTCKKIMTVSQLKQDYNTHNLRSKLCNLYDIFLVESEISEHVYSILGKNFIVKRKRPLQISTNKTDVLKITIEKAIKKISFKLNSNSNMSCIDIGTIKMDNVKIADNVMTTIEQLKEKWPGGWKNINRLFLKPMRQSKVSIPIFYSNINPNEVTVPVIKGSKITRLEKLAENLKKNAKKLKLDVKLKRLVRTDRKPPVKPETAPNTDTGKKDKKEKKNKKRKVDDATEAKAEESIEVTAEPTKKKKGKKMSESADIIPLETTAEPPAKKGKKNKAKEEVVEAVTPQSTDGPAKKKKKKGVKLDAPTISESVEQLPELDQKQKSKNKKKKAKAATTDAINERTAIVKEQSPKKSKKNKKNKA
jgi:hypothetical protein